MIAECLARQSNCFRDGVRGHVAPPFLYDRLPGDARGHLLQDICHQDSRSSERWLDMADGGIGNDEPPDHSLDRLLLGFCHGECLKHDYTRNRDYSSLTAPDPSFLSSLFPTASI